LVSLSTSTRFSAVALLHHRALVDEQAGQLDRLDQRAAAVVAQVDQHVVDLLLLQLAQQAGHVAGRALEVLVALAARLEVLVEGRQRDHADAALDAVLDFDDGFLGRLLFHADLLAHQRDGHIVLAVRAGVGRDARRAARSSLSRRGSA
jgi:hypothetical protein